MMSTYPLIYPMVVHVALTACLYVLLTIVRAPSIWGIGRRPDGTNPWASIEPRISANLSNQFEWPLFFYAGCLLLMQSQMVDSLQIGLAWTFIAGRLMHSYVQIMTKNVRLRGLVFTINFLAVLGMWALLFVSEQRIV
ncbi:MAG TPA: MAPEG family protein [Rhodocyclaceae bacterium]|nr:MAPEG family protein [Rhodocyclaceae bacterium]